MHVFFVLLLCLLIINVIDNCFQTNFPTKHGYSYSHFFLTNLFENLYIILKEKYKPRKRKKKKIISKE